MIISAAVSIPDSPPQEWLQQWTRSAAEAGSDILLCPGRYGEHYGAEYIQEVRKLSAQYKNLLICPGSFYEQTLLGRYHSVALFFRGDMVLLQRQIYLSQAERAMPCVRGEEINSITYKKVHMALLCPTDAWYPQVPRAQALGGARLLLAPVAFPSPLPWPGMSVYQHIANQNAVYVLTSGLTLTAGNHSFTGTTQWFSPHLGPSAPRRYGIVQNAEKHLLTVALAKHSMKSLRASGDPLQNLNIPLYQKFFAPSASSQERQVEDYE